MDDKLVAATLIDALKRAIAMAHFLGDSAVHTTPDWPDCDAPVCTQALAAIVYAEAEALR